MVYDGTKLGLNENIWVPQFPFPMINTHLRAVDGSTFVSNMDIGEMFLNFVLHESMEVFLCGVDLGSFFLIDRSSCGKSGRELQWDSKLHRNRQFRQCWWQRKRSSGIDGI
jgi:hypothetical protein